MQERSSRRRAGEWCVALTGLQGAPRCLLEGTKQLSRGARLASDAGRMKSDARGQRRRLLGFERRCRSVALIGGQLPDGSPAGGEGECNLGSGERGGLGAIAARKCGGGSPVCGQELLALGAAVGSQAGCSGIVIDGSCRGRDAADQRPQADMADAHERCALAAKHPMDMAMLALKLVEQTGCLPVVALAQARDDDAGDRALPGGKIGKAGF
jgi:hypothetical protein